MRVLRGRALADFAKVYPAGLCASVVRNFLPQGTTPGALTASATTPATSSAGVFAGQVLALQSSVAFSSARVLRIGFGSLRLQPGRRPAGPSSRV